MIGGFGLDAFPGAEPHAHSWYGPGQKAGAIFVLGGSMRLGGGTTGAMVDILERQMLSTKWETAGYLSYRRHRSPGENFSHLVSG